MSTVGERIKSLRKSMNLTQTELSKILNIKQQTLSDYENNKNEPDFEMATKICDYFKVSLDWFTGRMKDSFYLINKIAEEHNINEENLKKLLEVTIGIKKQDKV